MDKEQKCKKEIREILDKYNIGLCISGCGCCGSPVVSFSYDGRQIVLQEDEFNFSNMPCSVCNSYDNVVSVRNGKFYCVDCFNKTAFS